MSYGAARLILYAMLGSIEEDLRSTITSHLGGSVPARGVLGDKLADKAAERLAKDRGMAEPDASLGDLLQFCDFGDLLAVLNANARSIPPETAKYLRRLTPRLETLLPIRHRIAHPRPLHYDDLPAVREISNGLISERVLPFANLRSTLSRLSEDPSFVLGIEIPDYEEDASAGRDNLPIPDFDETGFIGRQRQIEHLTRLCLGPYPVITVLGEGGIGKTALALKVAYDIADSAGCPFEAIVWTSSKTAQLGIDEVVRIQGAIGTSLGLMEFVAGHLGGATAADPMQEVLSYLSEFRILLIIDNLETVLDDRIRSFVGGLAGKSKVLITSRIGLGAFEYPFRLSHMDKWDAVQLLRALAEIRGVRRIVQTPNDRLASFCEQMHNNPGYIKWFVSAVQVGRRPEEVLANPGLFLDFCMSNVYDYLGTDGKTALSALLAVSGRHTLADLAYLTRLDPLALKRALQQLLATNMVVMTSTPRGASFESQYEIGELARVYLRKHHPVPNQGVVAMTQRKRQLVATGEQVRAQLGSNPYSFSSLSLRSKADLPVAKYLLDGLHAWRANDLTSADELVAKARELSPGYSEVHRVEALLRVAQGSLTEAQTAYEAAIGLEPNSAPLRVWYGGFLLRYIQDNEAALNQFQKALELDPGRPEVKMEIARVRLYLRDFDEARSLLDELLSTGGLDAWEARRVRDLDLQFFQRRAEHLLDQQDSIGAIDSLEGLRKAFLDCPLDLRDRRILQKLEKARWTAVQCTHHNNGGEERERADAVLSWIEEETGVRTEEWLPGTVCRVDDAGRFGFLRARDGRELYFSRKACARLPRAGEEVEFLLGTNPQGPCAIRVRTAPRA